MIDAVALGSVLLGLGLVFAGATLSSYGVGVVGILLGGGGGYLFAPTLVVAVGLEGTLATVAGVLVGAALGVGVTYFLLSVAVAAVSFVVGTFLGFTAIAPVLVDGAWYLEWAGAVGVGIAAAVFGLLMTRTAMVLVTSFVGAALATRSVTPTTVEAARTTTSVEPLLFDVAAPLFLAVFVLGLLSQVGLFRLGYVAKVVRVLPGARALRNRAGRRKAGG